MLMRWVVVGTLLLSALAGCADNSTDFESGASVPIEVDGFEIAAENGVVRGVVTNDAGIPVPGARISLLGTEFFADTPTNGTFRFVNVTAGLQTVRAEAATFQVYEGPVEVIAGTVSWHNVTLVPKDGRGAGYRPHVHDYWGELTEITIMDEAVDIRERPAPGSAFHTHPTLNMLANTAVYSNTGSDYPIYFPEDVDPPAIVYPGTAEMQITLSWPTGPAAPDAFGLRYYSANSTKEGELEPQPSGSTWTIPVTPDMADNAHQFFTLWRIYVTSPNDFRETTSWKPVVITDPITVMIKLIKGYEPPLDPPHPEFWKNTDQIEVRNGSQAVRVNSGDTDPRVLSADEEKIVPPGTDVLRMDFSWGYADVPNAPIDDKYKLYWKTGGHRQPVYSEDRIFWETAEPVVDEDYRRVYELQLPAEDTDAFYQKKSEWEWYVIWDGADEDDYVAQEPHRTVDFYLRVVAKNLADE